MTESEFRRRTSTDLRARLELVDEALLAINGNIVNGRVPGDEAERDRCRLVGERIASKGRRVVDLLAKPPGVIAPDPRWPTIEPPDHREPGEEP
jgi:hypothetical protein